MTIRPLLLLATLLVSAALMAWVSFPGSSASSANLRIDSRAVLAVDSVDSPMADNAGFGGAAETSSDSATPDESQPTAEVSYDIRIARLQAQLDGIPVKDLSSATLGAIEAFRTHPTSEAEEFMLRILQRWAETDPGAAAKRLQTIPAPAKTESMQRVIQCWANQDISSAAAWANRLTDAADRRTALLALAQSASLHDPTYALTLASNSSLRREDFDIVSQAASTWAATSPEQAASWSVEITDPELRQQVATSIAASWADRDPVAAAQWLLSNESNWEQQQLAVFGIAQRLALQNPAAATRWAAQFPKDLHDSAMNELKRISERRRMVEARN